jgi:hypothetical protein
MGRRGPRPEFTEKLSINVNQVLNGRIETLATTRGLTKSIVARTALTAYADEFKTSREAQEPLSLPTASADLISIRNGYYGAESGPEMIRFSVSVRPDTKEGLITAADYFIEPLAYLNRLVLASYVEREEQTPDQQGSE